MRRAWKNCIVTVICLTMAAAVQAAAESGPAADKRLTEFRSKDTTFPVVTYQNRKEWERKAAAIRTQILVANGLWPMPEKTPLNAKRFGRIDRDGYSIEKAYFESYPGFYCTGNLYLPRGKKPPYPAMLCPHGHWKEGRLADEKNGSVVARCITFARQGYVVFSPDMVGYNDSKQMKHRGSGVVSPLWGISAMGLQTWNNIRGIDFLLTVEGVDPRRVGCTGASGGGTQTFILAAVDDRVACAVPVCMVSEYFQGGCECENPPLLRLNTTNIEIAASAAPRPYMLTGATGDWTKNIMKVQGPAIRAIYRLFNAEDKFDFVIVDAPHNYNKETREHVYRWMGRWLLNETDAEKLREPAYQVEKKEDMLVFTDAHPLPAGSLDEKGVRERLIERAKQQFEAIKPKDKAGLKVFAEACGKGLQASFTADMPVAPKLEQFVVSTDKENRRREIVLSEKDIGSRIPVLELYPKKGIKRAVVVVHPEGRKGLMTGANGGPGPLVAGLLEAGFVVAVPDCFLTGENAGKTRALPKEFPYTYNPTTLAWRVRDICATWRHLSSEAAPMPDLVGVGAAGPWCLLAANATGARSRTVVDANGFDDTDEASWQGEMYQPNILKYGGLRGAGALVAPKPLLIHNTQGKLNTAWIADVYRAAGAEAHFSSNSAVLPEKDIIQWLVAAQ
ncbi:MAG: acetylxylan esterase [Candidatus Sumerlaeia bacterium]|nr:acetylxylan esterase [Candidatus Sumerlaeia bacterium]